MEFTTSPTPPIFPKELVGKKILLATESFGPVNGVSRTTQSLVDYLRNNGANVATCAPSFKGQAINTVDVKSERQPILNPEWLRSVEAKSSALASRAIGGSWQFHFDRDNVAKGEKQSLLHPPARPAVLGRARSEDAWRKERATNKANCTNPDFRLQGWPLPYNPDLTVAYPFRLGVVYDKTFIPDVIYLASPASVGFQFLVQLLQLANPPPTLLNFQTDLSAYAEILFPSPVDRYAVLMLQLVQGYLFRSPAVRTIYYPSAYVRKYMTACGAPDDRMIQLGRGVDTELFHPGKRDESYRKMLAPDGEIIFACICRIAPEKGFEFLANAAEKLRDSGLPFKLLIVGGNKNPAVEDEVRGYFSKLPDHVIFTGMLRGTALARAYAAADVFLHCSITETFGLVVLESMASGVPVIARDEGGPSETVKHGHSGYLIPPHDMESFVYQTRSLALDHTLRQVMSANARVQALNTTWDAINNQVALELAATLAEHPPKTDLQKQVEGHYGSWKDAMGVYFAVGVVWIFWFIAVLPMFACAFIREAINNRKR